MPGKCVSEFFVVPPLNAPEIMRSADHLKAHMERYFPRYTFRVDEIPPFQQDEDFALIPMMGSVGGPAAELLEMPSDMEMAELYNALRRFKPGAALN